MNTSDTSGERVCRAGASATRLRDAVCPDAPENTSIRDDDHLIGLAVTDERLIAQCDLDRHFAVARHPWELITDGRTVFGAVDRDAPARLRHPPTRGVA